MGGDDSQKLLSGRQLVRNASLSGYYAELKADTDATGTLSFRS